MDAGLLCQLDSRKGYHTSTSDEITRKDIRLNPLEARSSVISLIFDSRAPFVSLKISPPLVRSRRNNIKPPIFRISLNRSTVMNSTKEDGCPPCYEMNLGSKYAVTNGLIQQKTKRHSLHHWKLHLWNELYLLPLRTRQKTLFGWPWANFWESIHRLNGTRQSFHKFVRSSSSRRTQIKRQQLKTRSKCFKCRNIGCWLDECSGNDLSLYPRDKCTTTSWRVKYHCD